MPREAGLYSGVSPVSTSRGPCVLVATGQSRQTRVTEVLPVSTRLTAVGICGLEDNPEGLHNRHMGASGGLWHPVRSVCNLRAHILADSPPCRARLSSTPRVFPEEVRPAVCGPWDKAGKTVRHPLWARSPS